MLLDSGTSSTLSPSRFVLQAAAFEPHARLSGFQTAAPLVATDVPCSVSAVPIDAPNRITRIVTPLLAQAWKEELSHAGVLSDFASVPVGIREGFDVGLPRDATLARFAAKDYQIYKNHTPALRYPQVIERMIEEETEEGRISAFYDPDELFKLVGPFRTAPLTIAAKNDSYAEGRVCQDFSHPRDDPEDISFNATIDALDFSCDWGTFAQCYVLAAKSPPLAQVAVFDVKAAHRRVPVLPWQQCFYAIAWAGLVALNFCCQFGAASSSGLWGRLADAFRAIFLAHFPSSDVLNWADDFIFWRYAAPDGSYALDEADIYALAARLGWPWSRKKTKNFSHRFNYLGFTWDLQTRTVEITEEKKGKYLRAIEKWIDGGSVSLQDAQSVLGKLVHCSLVVPEGRSRLPTISRFVAAFSMHDPRRAWKLPTLLIEDIDWWRRALAQQFCGMPVVEIPALIDHGVFVDASTGWGVGLVLDGVWDHWRLRQGWKSDGRDIGWAEMVAVELAVHALVEKGVHDAHVLIRSDNKGVVGALDAGKSRGIQANRVLQRIVTKMMENSIWISLEWVASADNISDAPSRGLPVPGLDRYKFAFKLPYALRELVDKVA